jgi:hypothetical protein
LRTLDNQTATFAVGEILGREGSTPFHNIQCEVKLVDAGNGKVYLWADFHRYQRLPSPEFETQITGVFRQIRKAIQPGVEIEFELQSPTVEKAKTRVKLATRMFTDKSMEEVETIPLPLPANTRKQSQG